MRAKPIIRFLSVVLVVAAAGALARAAWLYVTSLPAETALALAGVAGTIVGIGYGKVQDRNNEIKARQREKKTEVYQSFLQLWLTPDKRPQRGTSRENPWEKQNLDMMLWASDMVLKRYAALMRRGIRAKGEVTADMLNEFAALILEIRRDLNYKDRKTKADDILTFLGKDSGQWPFWPVEPNGTSDPSSPPKRDTKPITVSDAIGPER